MSLDADFPRLPWQDPFAPRERGWQRLARFAVVAGAHVLLIVGGIQLAARPEVREAARELLVRLVEVSPPKPEIIEARPKPVRQEPARLPPPPVLTAAAEAPAAASFTVAPQPPAPPRLEPVAPPPATAVTGARFDADYLRNPKPAYPVFSRRQGEEGKVLLRVRVSSEGLPLDVDIKQSSGFPRLDAAAREAVQGWRFIPAKRGEEPIESWVAVPIVFKLDT